MEQTRAKFIKSLLIGAGSVPILIHACKKDAMGSSTTGTTSGSEASSDTCIVSPTEEEGPFPYTADGTTRNELSNPLNRADIRSNSSDGVLQTGIPLALEILIVNASKNCVAIEGARVDLWHCNRYGWYSGYGGQSGGLSGQSTSYIGQNWLRGYQLTDANGQAAFTTVYPGWYQGRATHIHFEVFINSVLKKTTQLTFPETISDAVHQSSLYSAHGVNTTRNASDSVFGDSAADLANEVFAMTGDLTNGYIATHTIGIDL